LAALAWRMASEAVIRAAVVWARAVVSPSIGEWWLFWAAGMDRSGGLSAAIHGLGSDHWRGSFQRRAYRTRSAYRGSNRLMRGRHANRGYAGDIWPGNSSHFNHRVWPIIQRELMHIPF
jgi:hypothetical protein